MVDDDGFLRITDRVARFSKIGGEMVPHGRVEDAIREALGGAECVVVGVEDERKGERLAALYSGMPVAPDDLWRRLAATEIPRLWLPKRDDLHWVDLLPVLGTGKVDLQRAREMVQQSMMAAV